MSAREVVETASDLYNCTYECGYVFRNFEIMASVGDAYSTVHHCRASAWVRYRHMA